MKIKLFVRTLIILLAGGVYLFSSIKIESPQSQNIEIDTAGPLSVIWPFEISIVGDEGEKGLRIGANVGRGWRGEAGGQATYRFFVPADGTYTIWGYCFWYDVCANAVFVQIDDMEKAILGNDPLYNQWHWVRGFNIYLKRGTHTLVLSNHSDHIAIQKLFLTNSSVTQPQDCELVFSDIFYDGFDGCDRGNFDQWQKVCGKWQVSNPFDEMCFNENVLIGTSTDKAMITYDNQSWSDYSLQVSVQSIDDKNHQGSVGICLGVQNHEEYYQLTWRHIPQTDRVQMQVVHKKGGVAEVLTQFNCPWKLGVWHDVEITLETEQISIKIDSENKQSIPIKEKITGGIALSLEGQTTAYFDNIHVRQWKE